MVSFKVVIGMKSGQCVQKEIAEPEATAFLGKQLGESLKGDDIGLAGYEFEITGGSDYAGFPMRKDVPGAGRKRILAVSGIGLKKKGKGVRQRKTVCGNTIHPRIIQVNLKILKEGKAPLVEAAAEAPKEAKPAEKPAPKEAPAEKPKEEAAKPAKPPKPAEPAEEKPKATVKEQPAKKEAKPEEAPEK